MRHMLLMFLLGPAVFTLMWMWMVWTWSFIVLGGRTTPQTVGWLCRGGVAVFVLSYVALVAYYILQHRF